MQFVLLILLIIVPAQVFATADGINAEYVKASKNLGVGIKTPLAKLHVNGDILADTINGSFLGNGDGLELNGNTLRNVTIITSSVNGSLDFANGTILQTTTTSNPILWDANLEFSGDLVQQAGYVFKVFGEPSGNPEVALYSSNGQTGINTDTPLTDLDVNGQIMIREGNPGNGKVLTSDNNGLATWEDLPSSADNLGDHTATQALDMNGFNLIGANSVNGTTGNFTTVYATNFNGDFYGDGSNLSGITQGQWSDQGTFLHPADSSGAEDIVIGGTSIATGDIILKANGAAIFNEQGADVNFRIASSATTKSLTVNGGTGYVGIGGNDPSATLTITGNGNNGGIAVSNFVSSDEYGILRGPVSGNGTPAADSFRIKYKNNFNGAGVDYLVIDKTDGGAADPDGGIAFTNTGNDNTEEVSLIITGNGNVGIGSMTPAVKLQVNGAVMIVDGNQFNGYVLTSDNNGLASWQQSASGADDLGDHTATQVLDMNGFNLIGANSVNGTTGNFTTVYATTINGTTINATNFVGNGSGLTTLPSEVMALNDLSDAKAGTASAAPLYIGTGAGNDDSATNSTYSIGIGYQSLYNNDSDDLYNTAIGYQALLFNNGDQNTAVGYQTLYDNTTGQWNVALGDRSLANNTIGSQNTALGSLALAANTNGNYNVAIGQQTLYQNTLGTNNVASGYTAMYNNSTGVGNVATGSRAMFANTSGGYNVASGYDSMLLNTTGIRNVATGAYSLYSNTTGNYNTAVGSYSLYSVDNGSTANTALGYQAGQGTGGNEFSNGTFLGYQAGLSLTTGDNNTILGYKAGDNVTTGSSNIVIGYDIDTPSATTDGQLVIGNLIYGTGIDGTGTTKSSGNIGIGTSSPSAKLQINGSLMIKDGTQSNNYVLTSDGAGLATWTDLTSLPSNGDNLGDHTATTTLDMNGFSITDVGSIGINDLSPDAMLDIEISSASQQGLILKAASSQTANLTEWQNGSGTVFAHITKNGDFSNSAGYINTEIFGDKATANGTNSVVIGYNASGAGGTLYDADSSVIIGASANSGSKENIVIGKSASSPNFRNVVIGSSSSTDSSSQYSIAIGYDSDVVGYNSIGIGADTAAGYAVAIGGNTTGGHEIAIGVGAGTAGAESIAIGRQATANYRGSIALGYSTDTTAQGQFVVSTATGGIYDVYIGGGVTHTAPVNTTYNATGGSGTDINGGQLIFAGGKPTGSGDGGDIIFKTAAPGASGTTLRSLSERMRITDDGNIGINGSSPVATLQVNGSFMLVDGNQSNGYVLTSDNNGLASWQVASGGSDNLGDHTATQALDINGFNLIGASSVNGTTANFTTVNATNFNGGTFNGTLIGAGSTEWDVSSNVISNNGYNSDYADDFIIGSPSLDDDTDTAHDSRMFFDKSKGAFRSGATTLTDWDDSKRGSYSTALGYNTVANGSYSFAAGSGSTANGQASFAAGTSNIAFGNQSVAMGLSNEANNTGSTSFGYNNVSNGQYSTSFGVSNLANGSYSIAGGSSSRAMNTAATALGLSSVAAGYGSASIGYRNSANGQAAIAMGQDSKAKGTRSVAIGSDNISNGLGATALGYNNLAQANYSAALGSFSDAVGSASLALGNYTLANGTDSIAFGHYVTNESDYAMTIGRGNGNSDRLINNTNYSLTVGFNSNAATLFVGTSAGGSTTGNVGIGTSSPSGKLQIVGDEVRIGASGTISYATGDGELYVQNDLEVDGVIYGNGAGLTGISASALTPAGSDKQIQFNSSDALSASSNLLWNGTAGTGGSIEAQRYRSMQDGTNSTPAYSFESDSDTGMYLAAANEIAFTAGTTRTLTIEAGQVGVNDINPLYDLDVAGTTRSTELMAWTGSETDPSITFNGDVNTGIYNSAANEISFSTGGADALKIDGSNDIYVMNGDLIANKMIVFNGEVSNSTSGAITVDWNEGNRQYIAISGNVTALNFTNPSSQKPASVVLVLMQSASYTVSGWDTDIKWAAGSVPTITTGSGSIDVISCLYRYYASSHEYLCVPSQDFQ